MRLWTILKTIWIALAIFTAAALWRDIAMALGA